MNVLYESAACVAIHKPAGIPFHDRDEQEGLMVQIRRLMEEGALPAWGPLYPVHRLDAVTSGVLLLARSAEAARILGDAFAARRIQKLYVALSLHKPSKKQGRIVGDMERSRRGTWKLLRSTEAPAITRFVSQHIADSQPPVRLFLLKPETGKTHQIRVAMKSLGAPIFGDALYGGVEADCASDRVYLHAWRLQYDLFGESVEIVAPLSGGTLFLQENVQNRLQEWLKEPMGRLFP